MLNFVLNFLGLFFLALRGKIPDFFSILIGNVFLAAGTLMLYIGLARFLGRKTKQIHNYILLGLYVVIQAWFIYGFSSLHYRALLFSFLILIYCIQITWVIVSEKNKSIKSVSLGLLAISVIYVLLGVIRIINEFISPSGPDLLFANKVETSIYFGFQLVYILMTFSFFMMVNKRLVHQLELDIRIRQATESDLKLSQEKFFKAFQASPSSVIISRVNDGKFIDVNDRFITLSGYSRDELLSSSISSLDMWADVKERERMVHLIRTDGHVRDFEFVGKKKGGEILILSYSGEIIKIGEDDCLLSMLVDISERKQIEKVLTLQITLWQYSAAHNSTELMQKALDEIEELTGSKISFFHFMDAKTNSLKLQAWSTRTRDEFCKAEGEGMHYPIEKAGVWCDAVRLKQPIIHNDYESLVEKKGMPEGHARVIREMVVPIMRDDIVKAVIGVGNKTSDYTDKDVDILTNVANIAWFVILEKQADEEILKLNYKLENLAMTDELTQIANRRAFFIKGAEEILRARRYHLPLSIIMLDIDRFKVINDTFGHDSGDFALQCVAATLSQGIREVDIVGRLGGEEFAILLPNTKIQDAHQLAERLRKEIEEHSCMKREFNQTLTASFGVAEYGLHLKNLDEFLKNADSAMYQAKNSGRNRVEIFTSENI